MADHNHLLMPAPPKDHLPHLPFEIKKMVLESLSQKDLLLGVSRACSQLWSLAIPMGYQSVCLEVGPKHSSSWKSVATTKSCGIDFIRHFELRARYKAADKPKDDENFVIDHLLQALPPHRLLSFVFTADSPERYMSSKNLIILLATQRIVQKLHIPGIQGSSRLRYEDYVPPSFRLSALRYLQLGVLSVDGSSRPWEFMFSRSTDLKSIHVIFQKREGDVSPNWDRLRNAQAVDRVTRLTLRCVEFSPHMPALRSKVFPMLSALELDDCHDVDYFFINSRPDAFLLLTALRIKTQGYCYVLQDFLKRNFALQELLVDALHSRITDISALMQHAATLKLLSLRRHNGNHEKLTLTGRELHDLLGHCSALEHLSLRVPTVVSNLSSTRSITLHDYEENTRSFVDILAQSRTLKTLSFRCSTYKFSKSIAFGEQWEEAIGRRLIEQLSASNDSTALRHLSVGPFQHLRPDDSPSTAAMGGESPAGVFDIKPHVAFHPGASFKDALMAHYEGDDLQFLPGHLKSMVEATT